MFIFLSETKISVDVATSKFKSLHPSYVFSCDVIGSKELLIVLGWSQHQVVPIHICQKKFLVRFRKLVENYGLCVFLYGALVLDDRLSVWSLLLSIIFHYQIALCM